MDRRDEEPFSGMVGWRGLLVPQLAQVTGLRNVWLISSVIWLLFHVPLILGGDYLAEGTRWGFAAVLRRNGLRDGCGRGPDQAAGREFMVWPTALLHVSHNHLLRFLLQQQLPAKYGTRAIQPGHPVWEAVREAVLADPATTARERKLGEALDKARIEVRRLEYSEAELIGEVERLEKEIEEVKRIAAQDLARIERIVSG